MLQVSEIGLGAGPIEMHSCDWCAALREHEDEKLAEFSREMKRDNFRSWVPSMELSVSSTADG